MSKIKSFQIRFKKSNTFIDLHERGKTVEDINITNAHKTDFISKKVFTS